MDAKDFEGILPLVKDITESPKELDQILYKLVKDKYLKQKESEPTGIQNYFITIEGELFIGNKGYEKQNFKSKVDLLNKRLINFALIFGGAATGCYYTYLLFRSIFCV